MQKKRSGPEPVTPISRDGDRYEAVHWGKVRGLGQNGGYIAAIDERTGEELWVLEVYEVIYDGDMEPDKQDVFITALTQGSDADHLVVEHERGGRFQIDLKSRTVKQM